eukprot:Opistho-2@52537
MASFSSLPIEVLVTGVFPLLDQWDAIALSQTNSILRSHLRKLCIFRLTDKWSRLFYEDEGFRSRVLGVISRHLLAIRLDFESYSDHHGGSGVVDVSALGGVHTLNLSGCKGVVDVSALGGVHTLNLSDCSGVVDVSALGGIHTLDLHNWQKSSGCVCIGRRTHA